MQPIEYTKQRYIMGYLKHPSRLFGLGKFNADELDPAWVRTGGIVCCREEAERRGQNPGDVHLAAAQIEDMDDFTLFVSFYLSGDSIIAAKRWATLCPKFILRFKLAYQRLTGWGK